MWYARHMIGVTLSGGKGMVKRTIIFSGESTGPEYFAKEDTGKLLPR